VARGGAGEGERGEEEGIGKEERRQDGTVENE
jgi:hypothetical protein